MTKVTENLAFAAYGHDYRLVHISPADNVLMFQIDTAYVKLIWEISADAETYLSDDIMLDIDRLVPGDWEQNRFS